MPYTSTTVTRLPSTSSSVQCRRSSHGINSDDLGSNNTR